MGIKVFNNDNLEIGGGELKLLHTETLGFSVGNSVTLTGSQTISVLSSQINLPVLGRLWIVEFNNQGRQVVVSKGGGEYAGTSAAVETIEIVDSSTETISATKITDGLFASGVRGIDGGFGASQIYAVVFIPGGTYNVQGTHATNHTINNQKIAHINPTKKNVKLKITFKSISYADESSGGYPTLGVNSVNAILSNIKVYG